MRGHALVSISRSTRPPSRRSATGVTSKLGAGRTKPNCLTVEITSPHSIPRNRWLTAALAAALFGFVLGAKWVTVDRFGTDMPDWDQWDAEAMELYVPWFTHDHFVSHLFHPHNEHRIVITKLQNLGLALLNGQWDARLECLVNAALHSALAVAFWLLARRATAPRWHAPLFLLIAALFALPLAWQNILGGFHSQQYWLLGLSFAAVVVLSFARPWSGRWWAGLAAAVLALGSMGSGFLASVVVLGLLGYRILRREISWRETWPTLALLGLVIAIGAATRVEVYYHQPLKAKTAHDFIFSILRSLEWPLRDRDWVGAILWLPWALAAMRTWQARESAEARFGQTLLGLGGWVLVQLAATAYARGAGADYPASRYMDTPAFGLIVNGIALAWLLTPPPNVAPDRRRQNLRFSLYGLGAVWLALLGLGLRDTLERNILHELPDTRKYYVKAESHMRGYLATNDPAQLAFPDIPYPSASALIERLAPTPIRALMPVVVRAPLPLQPSPDSPTVFRENNASQLLLETAPRHGLSPATPPLASRKTWGSFDENGAATTGEWQSATLTASVGGWLKIETAGQLGEPGLALELHDARTGALIETVQPNKISGDHWRGAYVRAPRQPFTLVARDSDPKRWLAFSAPVEMGSLSFLAWQTAKNAWWLVYGSMAAAAGLGAFAWSRQRGPASVGS